MQYIKAWQDDRLNRLGWVEFLNPTQLKTQVDGKVFQLFYNYSGIIKVQVRSLPHIPGGDPVPRHCMMPVVPALVEALKLNHLPEAEFHLVSAIAVPSTSPLER